ncbi:hypothetical protein MTR67_000504 [Solanum verrucosum]|uniref:Uncharacterized protein n=1 Tax=Solanum verrucosum TaxID=315347 RepID=A0AAF0T722_SOLVR|nr:hypothetical protein MTR67_000457 [Solanum verrucosum]WMV07119.1 hypothetical protein MTR67_000504 [Solanum verrucosum]
MELLLVVPHHHHHNHLRVAIHVTHHSLGMNYAQTYQIVFLWGCIQQDDCERDFRLQEMIVITRRSIKIYSKRVVELKKSKGLIIGAQMSFFENIMVQQDVKCGLLKPNEATFVSSFLLALLSACVSTRLVNFGFQLVESVSCEFGVVAKMQHYGFMKKMPFEADATVLGL